LNQSRDDLLRELLLEKFEPIAIVGVGLRFPGGSTTLGEFESFLRSGGSGTGPVPTDRWDVEHYHQPGPAAKGRILSAGGGFLEDIDRFDAAFFNISPREAQFIDPQHRLALETTWEALENAGIDPVGLRGGNGGVYFGISCFDYLLEVGSLADEDLDAYTGTGTAHSAVPGRLSYLLGWRGPSMAVDTACSSSIVALDLAVAGLRRGDCDIAICGGVNAIHHPLNHIVFSQAGMLSQDGRCKTFDESADGYARSEGCGALVLKRYSDAKRAGDRILALVRGTAVRQDGESGGLTVPNSVAQEAVMRAALRNSSLDPADVGYVEAHGTGTSLGDPIEMRSIGSVFANSHTADNPVVVASLKTNLGHMEPAAGIGGVIKTVLQLHHAWFYPHLHLETPSSHIPWSKYPVRVPTEGSPWQASVRRAMVNSFGFAGTIATAVLEQAPDQPVPAADDDSDSGGQVFVLSAKSEKALRLQIARYRDFLAANRDLPLRDVAYTAAVGRSHFEHRIADVVADHDALAALLDQEPPGTPDATPPVAMLFTGQGSQYPGMGRALYQRHPVFREHLDECDRLFEPYLGRSVRDMILGSERDDSFDQTLFTQPMLFALEYATARLWQSFGVSPAVLIGHSIGEVVAAAIAEVFTLPDAVRLVAARARLMQSVTAPGGMVAVQATAADVAPFLAGYPDVAFAAFNAPQSCVVSGGRDALAEVVGKLTASGIRTRELVVSHAFHSPLMAEVYEPFAAEIADIEFHEPAIRLISNVTGAMATPELVCDPGYWVRHIGAPVDFAAGMQAIAGRGRHLFLEVGPDSTLLNLGRRCVKAVEHTWLASLGRDDPSGEAFKRAVAGAYRCGQPLVWAEYHRGAEGRRVTLPTYAFDRRRHWLPAGGRGAVAATARHPLLGAETSQPAGQAGGEREFVAAISPNLPGYLRDHVVLGQVVFPAAGYVELLLALQDAVYGQTRRPLRDLDITEPLIVPDDGEIELVTRLRPESDGTATVVVSSRVPGQADAIERRHATARIETEDSLLPELGETDAALRASAGSNRPAGDFRKIDDLYADFDDLGLAYGADFRRIVALRREGDDVAVATLRGHDPGAVEHLPPFLLDAVIQSVAGVLDDGETYLPVRFGTAQLLKKPKGETLHSLLRITRTAPDESTADMLLLDGGRPVMIVRDLGFRRVVATADDQRRPLYHEARWVKRSLVPRTGGGQPRDLIAVGAVPDDLTPDTSLRLAPDPAGIADLLAQRQPTDVCWFWTRSQDTTTVAGLREECERNFRDLLTLLDALQRGGFGRADGQRLWLVTDGAQQLPDDVAGSERAFAAATLWGFGRSLWSEYPAYRVTLVDLDGDPGPLLGEIQAGEAEEFQVAYRRGSRHVLRVFPSGRADQQAGNFELAIPSSGEFADLRPVPAEDRAPEGDEVQVRMHAAGLNFKDVLNALGMIRQYAEATGATYHEMPLGFEGAGTVVATGPDAGFDVGDEVVVSHLGCLRGRVVVPSAMVVRKPANISFAQAAGLPTAYVTAHYALHTLAQIKAGDRVLIHAAAGGVGQAAVALARLAGAEIFATASPGKHEFLRAQGIAHVMNSRTLDFADQIRERTGGAGVDIVLNSLNNDYIPAGFQVLAEGGRFVELGKIGVWTPEQAHAARPDVRYFNFDLSEFPERELQQITGRILREVVDLLADGSITPVTTTTYTLDEVDEAFSVLSRGANVGKLVIDLRRRDVLDSGPAPTVNPDATYLITGGLGALGLVTARRLVEAGARHLSLVGRRVVDPDRAAELRANLGADVQVRFDQADIADPADVERVIAEIDGTGHRLGGVVHAAGVLADGPVSSMTWPQIDKVFHAKVYGTWALHQAVAGRPDLEFFVGYSSVASTLGPSGQANYAAGNAFIDMLLIWRAAGGAPGLAIGWGPWAEVGMAANLTAQQAKAVEGQGLRFLKPRAGARALWRILGHRSGQIMVGEVDWDRFAAQRNVGNALYRKVVRGSMRETTVDLAAIAALPAAERRAAVNEAVRARIAGLLHFDDVSDISPHARFTDLGVDSLTAVELKNALESTFGTPLPTSVVFDYPTVAHLAEYLEAQLAPTTDTGADAAADEVERLRAASEDELDAELAALRSL